MWAYIYRHEGMKLGRVIYHLEFFFYYLKGNGTIRANFKSNTIILKF